MTAFLFADVADHSVQLACDNCAKPTDWVSNEVVTAMLINSYAAPLCWECAGVAGDDIPECLLLEGQIPDRYTISGQECAWALPPTHFERMLTASLVVHISTEK